MDALRKMQKSCKFDTYLDRYFVFPALETGFPLPSVDFEEEACDLTSPVLYAAIDSNPCFNVFHITDYCPILPNAIPAGTDYSYAPGTTNYFNRTDFNIAIHAPLDVDFATCLDRAPYVNGVDKNPSNPAADGSLARMIEFTNNVQIGNGGYDTTLRTNDTLLVLQNVTWHGTKGFSKYPVHDYFVPPNPAGLTGTTSLSVTGSVGTWIKERGLTYFHVRGAGHQIWQYTPAAAFRAMEVLLGRVDSLNETSDYSIAIQ